MVPYIFGSISVNIFHYLIRIEGSDHKYRVYMSAVCLLSASCQVSAKYSNICNTLFVLHFPSNRINIYTKLIKVSIITLYVCVYVCVFADNDYHLWLM